MLLKNKIVAITGAGRGIGAQIARRCAKEGAFPLLISRSKEQLFKVAQDIEKETGRTAFSFPCDVSNTSQVCAVFDSIYSQFPKIDALICAAGIYGPIGPLDTNNLEDWENGIQVNLLGALRCIHRVLPKMKEHKQGRILLFSGGGQDCLPNFSCYVASKGAIWRLTETLGKELSPFGIYLNAIAPGAVNTQFLEELLEAGPEKVGVELYAKSLDQKRLGGASPNKACDLAIYLLSEKSQGLYGKTLSALWDAYEELKDLEQLSKSDQFTFKRVVLPDGGTRYGNKS